MITRARIIRTLSDGKLHSGAAIGRKLGISRAAVFKRVKALADSGLVIDAVASRGYRLEAALTPLDRKRIVKQLDGLGPALGQIEILDVVDSTNRHLLARAIAAADPNGDVCLAEAQPQGRGRRGRGWIATPYNNLMLSMRWRFASGPAMVSGLSLAAGVAVVRALEQYGVREVGLKWPNDILWNGRKLAGLLVDVQGEAAGPCTVVLGVGINCRIAAAEARHIDQPWVDVQTITGETVDRNRLAALTLRELHSMFGRFARSGLTAFRAEWERHHLYTGQRVCVHQGDAEFDGMVQGIDDSGALRLRDAHGTTKTFFSGEVSLRMSTRTGR
jgi:BirA family biotin operon repressor/biotin-[acetyl-CoA-carboxylase] ligase